MNDTENPLEYIDALTPNYYNNKLQNDLKNDQNTIFTYIKKIYELFLFFNVNEYYSEYRYAKLDISELYIDKLIKKSKNILIDSYSEFFFFDSNFNMIMETIDKNDTFGFLNNKNSAYKVLYFLIYIAVDGLFLEDELYDEINKILNSNDIYRQYYDTNQFPMENILINYSNEMIESYLNAFHENKTGDTTIISNIYDNYKSKNLDSYKIFDKIIDYYNKNVESVFQFIKKELETINDIENEKDTIYNIKINEYNDIYKNKLKNFLSPSESLYYRFLNYTDDKGYIFNPSIIYIGNNQYISIFRNSSMVFQKDKLKYVNNPKGSYNCYNYPKSDLRKKEETFMWGNWGVGTVLYDDSTIISLHDNDFVIDLNKKIDINITSNDRRLIKLDMNKYFDTLYDFNSGSINELLGNDQLSENYIVLTHDSNLNHIDLLDSAHASEFLYNIGLKGKNYGFIGIHDNKLIFTDWFYKDGLKIIKIDNKKNVEQINVLSPIKIFGSSSMTNENNMPEFSFSTPNLDIGNNEYIGVGHIKIKNYSNYYDKNILYSRTLTNLYRYLNCENSCEYIRHAANTVKCVGYQYYIFFYVFKINDDFTKMEYFKISDSFIPFINDNKEFYEDHEYSLVFPNGLDYNQDEDVVIISLGEGDVRNAILKYKLENILKSCIHDITNINMEEYNIYPIIY